MSKKSKCKICKVAPMIPSRAKLNLEAYKVGGVCLVASECCSSPFLLKMNVSYTATPYTGDEKEDDWGEKFTTD